MTKHAHLEAILAECESVCIGYSGGVDSAFLAVTALDVLGADNVLAVTGRSASYPSVQWETARQVARLFQVPHLEIDTNELNDVNYRANPSNRCYYCKTELWSKLLPIAHQRGLETLVDGSNADDAHDHRPGAQAARERGVRSPLMEAGLTKQEIRDFSRARGIPTWDQPSSPCLSSRLPYGLAVTPERLRQVEAAEAVVRSMGIREFRVRHHGAIARIEVAHGEINTAIDAAPILVSSLTELGFEQVVLDAEGYRRGALNEPVQIAQKINGADIAILQTSIADARTQAPELRKSGFRYIAVDLNLLA
jgi:pyridinium-3,5-biscarboxylic acid mononucleotide sulfurtransferase